MFVGLLLPAARPHELELPREAEQVSGRGGRKEVGDALDRVERPLDRIGLARMAAGERVRRPSAAGYAGRARGREQGHHAVDVDQQKRLAVAVFRCVETFFS